MGYTHYYTFKAPAKGTTAKANKNFKRAILACQKLIYAYAQTHGGISGYNAHTKPGVYGGLNVNGSRENGHENFVVLEHLSDNVKNRFNFCKTARKPYDVLVVACLCVLNHYLSDCIEIASDGDSLDWIAGLDLARSTTGLKTLKLPKNIRVRLSVVV